MTREELRTRLQDVFRQVLGRPELDVHPGLTAGEVEEWDSLAHVNLLFAIEDEFGVQFRQDEMASLADVGDLMAVLEGHLGG